MTNQPGDWHDFYGVLAPYLPDLPSEEILRRTRERVCLYCGSSHCTGCNQVVRHPVAAMRSEDV